MAFMILGIQSSLPTISGVHRSVSMPSRGLRLDHAVPTAMRRAAAAPELRAPSM